jgi:putative membrane protein
MLAAGDAALRFQIYPTVWLAVASVIVFFWWAFTRLGPRIAPVGEQVVTRRQLGWTIGGIGTLWAFADWPVHQISEDYLFFVHMTQHTVFTLVAPACFLMGAPAWLSSWILGHRPIGSAVRFFGRPLVALMIFNAVVVLTHFPFAVERSVASAPVHIGVHLVLFFSALMMWFPVINRVDGYPKLSTPVKMIYLFAQSIVPTVPASFLTFTKTAFYDHYANAPRLIPGFSAVEDLVISGAIMKLVAGTYLWFIVIYLFFSWYAANQRGADLDNQARSGPGGQPSGSDASMLTFEDVQAAFARIDEERTRQKI